MSLRRTAIVLAALGLAACRDSTGPDGAQPLTDAPVLGTTLTIAGASALSGSTTSSISSSLSGNPYALTAGSATLPPPPTCGAPVEGVTRCTSVLNGLTIGYAFGWQDSLGLRVESQVTGTLLAQGSRPEQQVERSGTIWTQLLTGGSNTSLTTRHRSTERGVTRQNGSPRVVMTDTATTDVRLFVNLAAKVNDRLPRMVGSSTRVIWTSKDGGAPTFWRETTTYDSSAVVRSTITTPTGTRQCSIDLAATVIALTCR